MLIFLRDQEVAPWPVYYKAQEKALNNGQNYHLAAILRRGKSVVKIGSNTCKTHPRFKRVYSDGTEGSCMHAEMSVVRFAKPGDIIEVIRFKKCGTWAMARPCNLCMEHMKFAGIKKVRYTNSSGQWEILRVT